MSHTVNPYAHRIGILRDWRSRWFASGSKAPKFREFLKADVSLREYLERRLKGNMVDSIEMERGENSLRVIIKTSRPGLIIGRSGEGAVKLKTEIGKYLRKIGASVPSTLNLDVVEVRSPESRAALVGQMVAEAIEKRTPFRRVLKQAVEKVMANRDAKGVKILISGRLDGAEMGRTEHIIKGKLPLQTFRADVDFARVTAHYPRAGAIGIKVWIYRGEIFSESKKNKNKE